MLLTVNVGRSLYLSVFVSFLSGCNALKRRGVLLQCWNIGFVYKGSKYVGFFFFPILLLSIVCQLLSLLKNTLLLVFNNIQVIGVIKFLSLYPAYCV